MLTLLLLIPLIGTTANCHPHHHLEAVEDGISHCGYPSCPTPIPGKLNVHIVPHSHDDVGWLKTVDQYYYGSLTRVQNAGVQYILDSVVQELLHDPKKKFIYVETAFFWKWWLEQDDHLRHQVKRLVANGQLEFIGGAWSMNDEATTHYQSVIDQFTWGFRKLNDTFGYCGQPKIGWQIDPFGHARETASLMAQMGFDGLFFGRLDYQDKRARLRNKTMEMIWEGSASLGSEAELLTGALYNFYSAPDGFCFDILCDDDPIIDDKNSPEYNVDMYVQKFKKFADKQSEEADLFTSALFNEYAAPPGFCFDVLCNDDSLIDDSKSSGYNVDSKVDDFLKYVRSQSTGYSANNILLTMGEDFHYQAAHMNYKNLDLLIRGSDIFTGVLFNLYQAPLGFCFDIMCGDEPVIDDKNSRDYNVDKRVDQYLNFIESQRKGYATDNLLVTMGGDFNYQDAHYYFKNLDKLIRYVNERQENGSDVNVFYSTPSCYVKSLNGANIYWPTKKDDFFPYASDPHSYWTGYFTSRPTIKYFERIGNNYLQICKQLSVTANLGPAYDHDLNSLREAMGIMQHHDAITGTEKQHVANDYARILTGAFHKCGTLMNEAVNRILGVEKNAPKLELKSCLLTNISECSISSDSTNFVVTIYNPLSRPVDYYVRLPVFKSNYIVYHPDGSKIGNELVPIPEPLMNIPGRKSKTDYELLFKAESLPALGYRSYFISKTNKLLPLENSTNELNQTEDDVADELYESYLNISDGDISLSSNSSSVIIKPSVHYYIGEIGNNMKPENRSSGAYIFRPKGVDPIELNNQGKDSVHKGKIVTELHQIYSEWASHVIRQYAGEEYVEVEWLVGPIPVADFQGKEVIWRYNVPQIHSNDTFFTDSSGRETLERVRNYRPTWDVELKEPVSGNYYPVTTDISINDGDTELTVLIDRAQGGTSLKSGEIELMVHRRLLHDDAFGVGEALNEVAYEKGLVVRGHHWILAGKKSDPEWAARKRHLQQQKLLNSHVLLANADSLDFATWSKYKNEFSGLNEALPDSVQILTLEPWKGSSILLRLEHIFEKNESEGDVSVNLNNLFVTFDIVSIRETTLGANQWLDEASRLKWKKETNEVGDAEEETTQRGRRTASLKIKLRPKEIRTFICQIKLKQFV